MGVESAHIPLCEAEEKPAAAGRTLTSVIGGWRERPPMGANNPPQKSPSAW